MESRRFAEPDVLRLWAIGGANNVVRWLELLAAALFTLQLTKSGFAVAAVTSARTMPLLLFGALAGVLSESVNRKTIQAAGMSIIACSSLGVCLLSLSGTVQVWHIALAGFVSGTVWSTDMSTRRRMVAEAAASHAVARVIALDSLAGALTRMIGPIAGAAAYSWIGLTGAYAVSTVLTLATLTLLPPITNLQVTKPLALARVPRELAEGVAIARRDPVVRAVLGVTIAMNLFGFSYSALVVPIGLLVFKVPITWVGLLAAAEPLGALIGGMALAMFAPRMSPRVLFVGGGAMFLVMVAMMPYAPGYLIACGVLVIGGLGTAGFSNMQTTLVMTGTAPAVRSRLLGLITVCIGTGPIGLLLSGALADRIGLLAAVQAMALAGLAVLVVVGWEWLRAERVD